MRKACYCGRTGEIADREPVAANDGGYALRCPECSHLDHLEWLPEDARMLLLEEAQRKGSRIAA